MAKYLNAREVLPLDLVAEVLKHLPEEGRNGALIYFSDNYYLRRNAEIVRCFHIYQADPRLANFMEIYEALAEQYKLTVRQICKIVKAGQECGEKPARRQRRYSGIRVDRVSRRMRVRTTIR